MAAKPETFSVAHLGTHRPIPTVELVSPDGKRTAKVNHVDLAAWLQFGWTEKAKAPEPDAEAKAEADAEAVKTQADFVSEIYEKANQNIASVSKQDLIDACDVLGVERPPNATKAELLALIADTIEV